VARVDYFWEQRQVPVKHGEEPWTEAHPTKARLIDPLLRGILMRQLTASFLGIDKFNLIVVAPEPGNASTILKGSSRLSPVWMDSRE
jgi:hypothetical protein